MKKKIISLLLAAAVLTGAGCSSSPKAVLKDNGDIYYIDENGEETFIMDSDDIGEPYAKIEKGSIYYVDEDGEEYYIIDVDDLDLESGKESGGSSGGILIGSMLGYISSSKITSANSTAASLKNNIDTFLTNADTSGYGMKQGRSVFDVLDIIVTTSDDVTTWTVSAANSSCYKGNEGYWGYGGSANMNTVKAGVTSAETLLAIEFAQLFPEIEKASIKVLLNGGKCTGIAYAADVDEVLEPGVDCPDIDYNECKFVYSFEWDGKNSGVNENKVIVGTSPIVYREED